MSTALARPRDAKGRFVAGAPIDLEAMREAYEETDKTRDQIAAQFKIGPSTLQRLIRRLGWIQRQPHRVDPNDLTMRMFVVLGKQLTLLEKNVTKTGAAEAMVLGRLATTLDRLIEIRRTETKRQSKQRTREIDELRDRIAARIAELNAA